MMSDTITLIFSNATTGQTVQDQTYNHMVTIPVDLNSNTTTVLTNAELGGIPGVPADAQITITYINGEMVVELDTAWDSVKNIDVESTTNLDVTLKNFVHTDVELGGTNPSEITLEDAKRGTLTSGDGNDVIAINAYSNGGWSNEFVIDTGDGDDIVDVDVATNGETVINLDAGDGDDVVTVTGDSDDTFVGGAGNDTLTGGLGDDIATYAGALAGYTVFSNGDGTYTVRDDKAAIDGDDGTDIVDGIETLQFADGTIDLSTLPTGPDAIDSAMLTPVGVTGAWKLTGAPGVEYSIDPALGQPDDQNGYWVELDALTGARVRLVDANGDGAATNLSGDYEYDPGTHTGEDSFTFRTTDTTTGLSDIATVNVGVGSVVPYEIEHSAHFDGIDDVLNREPGSTGNTDQWTVSTWVKWEGSNSTEPALFGTDLNENSYVSVNFLNEETLRFRVNIDNNDNLNWTMNVSQFGDYGGDDWQNFVFAVDLTDMQNPLKVYRNGELLSFASQPTTINSPVVADWNKGGIDHWIGAWGNNTFANQEWGGHIAEFISVDGQTLDASAFGELNTDGVWVAKDAQIDNYGTNGFHLDFADDSSTNSMGTDVSGNGNNWTVVGDIDQSQSTPNHIYVELNPDDAHNGSVVENGTRFEGVTGKGGGRGTIGADSGKWYFEIPGGSYSDIAIGWAKASVDLMTGDDLGIGSEAADGFKLRIGSAAPYSVYTHNNITEYSGIPDINGNDVLGVAFDMDAGVVQYFQNGTLAHTANIIMGSGLWYPVIKDETGYLGQSASIAFEESDWVYSPPAGFSALVSHIEGVTVDVQPTPGHDSFEGGDEANDFDGLAGDDQLIGNGGDDTLTGGDGNDVAVFNGVKSDYTITNNGDGTYSVRDDKTDVDGDDGTDIVDGIETLKFADGTIDLSTLPTGPDAIDSAILTPNGVTGLWKLTGEEGVDYSIDPASVVSGPDQNGWYDLASGAQVRLIDSTKPGETGNGVISNTTGHYEYKPNGTSGEDSFAFRTTDSQTGLSDIATVNVGIGGNFTKIGNEFQTSSYPDTKKNRVRVESLIDPQTGGDGGYVVMWQSYGQDDPATSPDVYGQIYDANDQPVGGEFKVNNHVNTYQGSVDVKALPTGGFIVVWNSFDYDGSGGAILGKVYDANGNYVKNDFRINNETLYNQEQPSIVLLENGGAVVTWESQVLDGELVT